MKLRPVFILGLFLLALLLVGLWLPAQAAPAPQLPQYATPTPGPDGRIIYIAKEGDNCTSIALKNAITVEQLRLLNRDINADCTNIIPGQQLLLGLAGPAAGAVTRGPSPTPLPPTITPTPFTGTTEVCVLVFDDQNGDALRQESEPAIPGGAISLTDTQGKYSKTQDTAAGADPVCFGDVPEGEYHISVAIPDTYNPTMSLAYTLTVKAGDRAFVDFGAQSRAATATTSQQPSSGGASPWMGILGTILLLGAAGLGWYAIRLRRPKDKIKLSGMLKR